MSGMRIAAECEMSVIAVYEIIYIFPFRAQKSITIRLTSFRLDRGNNNRKKRRPKMTKIEYHFIFFCRPKANRFNANGILQYFAVAFFFLVFLPEQSRCSNSIHNRDWLTLSASNRIGGRSESETEYERVACACVCLCVMRIDWSTDYKKLPLNRPQETKWLNISHFECTPRPKERRTNNTQSSPLFNIQYYIV